MHWSSRVTIFLYNTALLQNIRYRYRYLYLYLYSDRYAKTYRMKNCKAPPNLLQRNQVQLLFICTQEEARTQAGARSLLQYLA